MDGIAGLWRESWEATGPTARIVLGVVAVVAIGWVVFAIWFALSFDF